MSCAVSKTLKIEGPLTAQKLSDAGIQSHCAGALNKCNRKTHGVTIQAYPRPDGIVVSCGSCVVTLVKAMRIPCFGRRMTIGRASIVWPVSR